jgi:disulfide bond formation protein DsbB
MSSLLRLLLDRWRLCALLISAAMLAIAHAFERFGGLAPCILCLKQREVYWWVGGLAIAFMVLVRLPGGARWRAATCWMLGLGFLIGAGVAAYHAGAEWKFWPGPAACAAVSGRVTAEDLQAFLNNAKPYRGPSCETPAWVFAGLSMAGWNAVASVVFAGLSGVAGWRERARR